MQARVRFREFARQRRRDAVARCEQRHAVEQVRVADHEGHGHRLAERAAQAQHDAADDARLGRRPIPSASPAPVRTRRASPQQ
ncbi:hypothetical protein G6F68_020182 [Rhizopus microsporus]|nr:hypothetical protein G6F68_020182 [Rhizopus microsporus]